MQNMNRDIRLDILRIMAISMVVLMHSPIPYANPGAVVMLLSYITAPGLVLFFMISGALLLGSSLSTEEFLNRRFKKILFPTIFWTLFYLIVNYAYGETTPMGFLKSLLSLPFNEQGTSVLWFMYTLAGLYLLTPILSCWLKKASKHEIEFYLLLWGISLLYPYLSLWLWVDESNTGVLYYFSGYVGYFVLGYYLRFFYDYRRWHVFFAIIVALFIPLAFYVSRVDFDFYSVLWYLSLPVALLASLLFIFIRRLPGIENEWLPKVANLSFGVYFVHIFIMRRIIWSIGIINDMPGLVQIFLVAIISLLLSYIVSWLISKLPFSKYIIGA